ncbi:MAG: hypothetical protein HYV60_02465, partial [Planctomycetia bacterium]|nr:hypothetical protein [Planctomycetia bacterium]
MKRNTFTIRLFASFCVVLCISTTSPGQDTDVEGVHAVDFVPIATVDYDLLTRKQWIELIDSRLAEHLQTTSYQPEPRPNRDSDVIVQGEAAFWDSCTACHDAVRALEKTKTYGQWLVTIRRMAAKDGAAVSPADINPIADYLASRSMSAG